MRIDKAIIVSLNSIDTTLFTKIIIMQMSSDVDVSLKYIRLCASYYNIYSSIVATAVWVRYTIL